ncbi:MAG: AgmX/PglI C-terminal domain-containing protein [Pseudobdellovibrio sp.]
MKSPLVFRIYKNEQIYVVKQFVDDDRIVLGRGAEVHIYLDSSEVSPIHCIVEKRGSQFYICDLGSQQGTFKKGAQVLDEPINSGDSFQIGSFNIVFSIGSQKTTQASEVKNDKPVIKAPSQAVAKPRATQGVAFSSTSKSVKTYAPKSEFSDLKDHLKPGSGSRVEVIVSWKERIIETYHFSSQGKKILGLNSDIVVPEGSAPKNWLLLDIGSKVTVYTTDEMQLEILRDGEVNVITDREYKLQQSEACFIQLINGMQLVIRFAPKTPAIILDSPVILGTSELTGILASLIIAVLAGLLVSVSKPKPPKENEDIERVAQIIFTTPPPKLVQNDPIPPAVDLNKKLEEEKKQKEELKKALLMDQKKESKIYGDPAKPEQKAQTAQSAGRAAEIKPKDSKLKAKIFTSTKQGGSVKTGEQSAANAQSKDVDPNNSGLLAAFGEGGARNKLDQVYSGSGELIGAGEKAKGVSGFNSDLKGDDLGSKIKDTGAGGNGTATQGIAGIGTKGRSTGMSGYGSGTGFGDKDRVQISAGGTEEAFVGSIDKEAVRRAIRSALPAFKRCFEREYSLDTKLEGKVFITWEIHERGVAKNARVVKEKSTINNSIVEECVRAQVMDLKYPEPPVGTSADISYPFIFRGQKL